MTWETCSLRKWLNNEFYNEAFSKEEQKLITQTTVVNDDNSEHGTEERNATNDNVFLLSIAEASNPIYGFAENFAESSKTRKAKVTDYAWLNDRWHNIDENYAYGAWWLRSPSLNSCMAANVSNSGCGDEDYVVNSGHVIRPALHINLSSAQISESGEISVKSGDIDEPTPSEKPTPTPPPSGLVTPDPTTPVVPGPSVSTTPTTTVPQTQNPTGTNLTGITAQEQQATKNDTKRKKQKKLKLSSIKAKRNKKKITGKVSVSKATVKIKVGKKAYKKAKVKGKKFTLNVKKLKKKTKITIRVTKKGYRTLKKTVRVK